MRFARPLLLAALVMWPAPASAFELTETPGGVPLEWAEGDIAYGVVFDPLDEGGRRLAAASRRAFDTWAFASRGALSPRYLGPAAASDPADGANTIREDAIWDPAFGEPARAVAFAWVAFDPETGRIREGDVHLNAERFTFGDGERGAFDTESVVLHELGHVLGLAHTCGLPGRTYSSCFSVPDEPPGHRVEIVEAVMAPTLAPGTRRRRLGADDRAGLAAHFDGGLEARPRIAEVRRRCPEGAWVVELQARWPGVEVLARGIEGDRVPWPAIVEGPTLVLEGAPPPAPFDLVVSDPSTGVYDAWVQVERPPDCVAVALDAGSSPPQPPESPAGCTCAADLPTESGRGASALVMLVLSMFVIASRRALAAALLVAATLTAAPAAAFECSRTGTTIGPSLVWGEREVTWYVGPGVFALVGDEAQGREDVLGSFSAWEAPACSDLLFPFAGETTVKAGFDESGDNRNVVVAVGALWPYQTGAIAVTTTAYDTRTGVVVDADIEINESRFRFAHVDDNTSCSGNDNLMDLRNTLTHEVGHIVGLEHPPNTARYAEATMYASAPACEIKKRTLAQDDIDGLCFIYPAGAATQQCYPPEGPSFVVVDEDDGFGGCSSAGAEVMGLWGLVVVGLVLLRPRRSKSS